MAQWKILEIKCLRFHHLSGKLFSKLQLIGGTKVEYENIKIEIADKIAVVSINRPKALNALNTRTIMELGMAFQEVYHHEEVLGVILTGEGQKAFVAGADIEEMSAMTVREARDFAEMGQEVLNEVENFPKPVIAAVNGYALGGGTELAMACDIILASENARFGQPEVKLGVIPGFGGTQRLMRRVGMHIAKELIFTGQMIDAKRAKEIGLVSEVYPQDRLMEEAKKMMTTIISNGPFAVATAKYVMNAGADMPLLNALILEKEAFAQCFAGPDQAEGMKAFLEKRTPNFVGK